VQLKPGEHVCVIHDGPDERNTELARYIRDGSQIGSTCLVALDEIDGAATLRELDAMPYPGTPIDHDSVRLLTTDNSMVDTERPLEATLRAWESQIEPTLTGGAATPRLAAEAGVWLPMTPDIDELLRNEELLSRFASRSSQTLLCLYDITRYGERIVSTLLQIHHKVILRGALLDNPYFVSAAEHREMRTAESTGCIDH
jgi:hypothetical protein